MATKKIKLTFLGTGTSHGIPVIACECEVCKSTDPRDKRLRVSAHIETEDKSIVIDTGPDFRYQMLRANIKKIDAVLFTHEHKDHTAGLDDIRAFNYTFKRDIPVYATTHVIEQIKQAFSYIFAAKKYPGIPKIQVHEIDDSPFFIGKTQITPINVMHHKLPVKGYRFGNLSYITDANHIEDHELEKIRGSEVIVLNALQKKSHMSHFSLKQAIEILEELKPKQAYLIHMNHKMGKHADVAKELPDFIHLAYDGLQITV